MRIIPALLLALVLTACAPKPAPSAEDAARSMATERACKDAVCAPGEGA